MCVISSQQFVVCVSGLCYSHWHEHRTVVCSTQLGDTVQEDGGHPLVLVLYESEHFKGKATHLALPILKDGGLGVFFTAGSQQGKLEHVIRTEKRE